MYSRLSTLQEGLIPKKRAGSDDDLHRINELIQVTLPLASVTLLLWIPLCVLSVGHSFCPSALLHALILVPCRASVNIFKKRFVCLQGNMQRCKLVMDQVTEARDTMMKVLDHKEKVLKLLNKNGAVKKSSKLKRKERA